MDRRLALCLTQPFLIGSRLSQRSTRNRKLLMQRIALLALSYALPLGGLAIFFLTTGLNYEIALGERERLGVRYIRQTMQIYDRAIQEMWRPDNAGKDESGLDQEIAGLESLERGLASQLH